MGTLLKTKEIHSSPQFLVQSLRHLFFHKLSKDHNLLVIYFSFNLLVFPSTNLIFFTVVPLLAVKLAPFTSKSLVRLTASPVSRELAQGHPCVLHQILRPSQLCPALSSSSRYIDINKSLAQSWSLIWLKILHAVTFTGECSLQMVSVRHLQYQGSLAGSTLFSTQTAQQCTWLCISCLMKDQPTSQQWLFVRYTIHSFP